MADQIATDKANREFWDELCGSGFARAIGITDHSMESLKKFDAAYFDFYPYLLRHIDLSDIAGRDVLEIGLGYGTVGQKLAEAGGRYVGLDIAEGPVHMMNYRMRMQGLPGKALGGSILDCPLRSESMDLVVAIGCYHHTGNVQRSIDETYRILKPGGRTVLMLYNQRSYRQWKHWPVKTLRSLLRDWRYGGRALSGDHEQRMAYDRNAKGQAAPETTFVSIAQLKRMLSKFSRVAFRKENCHGLNFLGREIISRKRLLPLLGRWFGLDIYLCAWK